MIFDSKSLVDLVSRFSYVGCSLMVFFETGFFFGIILPGDTMLALLGLLASKGKIDLWLIMFLLWLSAILGSMAGYWQGDKLAHWVEKRPDGFFFTHARLKKAKDFFDKYGTISILVAKFVPIVRNFVAYVAGMTDMPVKRFLVLNMIGSAIWVIPFCGGGYLIGRFFPELFDLILHWAILFFFVLILSVVVAYVKMKRSKRA